MKVGPRRARNVNASIGGPYVSVQQVRTIPLAPEEMESSLAFEARKHLPLDESEAILDFQILSGDMESSHMEILLAAMTQKIFSSFVSMMKELGIRPRIIDAESLALVNSYLLTHKVEPGEIHIFLELPYRLSHPCFPSTSDSTLVIANPPEYILEPPNFNRHRIRITYRCLSGVQDK